MEFGGAIAVGMKFTAIAAIAKSLKIMTTNETMIRFKGRVAIKEPMEIGQEVEVTLKNANETVVMGGAVIQQLTADNNDGTIDVINVIQITRT